MKVVLQRCHYAKVTSDGVITGSIQKGLVVLIGAHATDDEQIVDQIVDRVIGCRIFNDNLGKINLNLEQVGGSILAISNFTLCGDAWASRRPSFMKAAPYEVGKQLYDRFIESCRKAGVIVEAGVFGADMVIEMAADGPVTLVIDL